MTDKAPPLRTLRHGGEHSKTCRGCQFAVDGTLGYRSFETGGRPGHRFLEEGPMHPLRGELLLTLDVEETEDKVIPVKFSIIEKNNLKPKGDVYEAE